MDYILDDVHIRLVYILDGLYYRLYNEWVYIEWVYIEWSTLNDVNTLDWSIY